MKLDYTKQELALQLASLAQVLGTAQVVDPYRGALLDPATLEPCGESDPVPTLDEDGRGMQLVQAETGDEMRLYQSIRVEDKPCVLVVHCALPRYRGASAGAKNSYDRALAQYCADMRHDYVTASTTLAFWKKNTVPTPKSRPCTASRWARCCCASTSIGSCAMRNRPKRPSAA